MGCVFTNGPVFPCDSDGRMCTKQFLDASRNLVSLLDEFGKIFNPAKNDLLHNIEKIEKCYKQNVIEYGCLMVMLKKEKNNRHFTDSFLWLRRGLRFWCIFLTHFMDSERKYETDTDIATYLRKAYDESLRNYHGFFVRLGFEVMCARCPSRPNLLAITRLNQFEHTRIVEVLEVYLNTLSNSLDTLINVCKNLGLSPLE